MRHVKLFEKFIDEKFADVFPKKTWVDFSATRDEFADEIIPLIQNAYRNVPGGTLEDPHVTLDDKATNFWVGDDMDVDPECDAIIFGKKTAYGVKITGVGQDGSGAAKKDVLVKLKGMLSSEGVYTEVSDRLADMLGDLPYIGSQEDVERILNKKVQWVGKKDGDDRTGWYSRDIHGHTKTKILVGHPGIK